jgi:hypothetical protein
VKKVLPGGPKDDNNNSKKNKSDNKKKKTKGNQSTRRGVRIIDEDAEDNEEDDNNDIYEEEVEEEEEEDDRDEKLTLRKKKKVVGDDEEEDEADTFDVDEDVADALISALKDQKNNKNLFKELSKMMEKIEEQNDYDPEKHKNATKQLESIKLRMNEVDNDIDKIGLKLFSDGAAKVVKEEDHENDANPTKKKLDKETKTQNTLSSSTTSVDAYHVDNQLPNQDVTRALLEERTYLRSFTNAFIRWLESGRILSPRESKILRQDAIATAFVDGSVSAVETAFAILVCRCLPRCLGGEKIMKIFNFPRSKEHFMGLALNSDYGSEDDLREFGNFCKDWIRINYEGGVSEVME